MQIDTLTVLLFSLCLKAGLGGLFMVFWYQHRSATWYGWWGATFLLGCTANMLFIARGFASNILAIGVGGATLIAAIACCWQAARVFNQRPSRWWPVAA